MAERSVKIVQSEPLESSVSFEIHLKHAITRSGRSHSKETVLNLMWGSAYFSPASRQLKLLGFVRNCPSLSVFPFKPKMQ